MLSKISGWGNSTQSYTTLRKADRDNLLINLVSDRGVISRGLGRSYGDSASNAGGITLDCSNLKGAKIDTTNGIATLSAGVTIIEFEKLCLPHGYFPYVVPGTGNVTIGGAIASDIHGKSHHKVGSFSNHVLEIKLLTSEGHEQTIYPHGETSQIFWATIGGMGLTGLILEAKIKLLKIETAYVKVVESRSMNLNELLTTLIDFNEKYLYTVAWIDLSGKFEGRGVVSGADHAKLSDLKARTLAKKLTPLSLKGIKLLNPFKLRMINNLTIRIFNVLWFYKPLRRSIQHVETYMHPLDSIQNWNTFYGKKGFIQYQFVVPYENSHILPILIGRLRDSKCSSLLSVIKSFGNESEGLLSFPLKGWTLAVDLSIGSPDLIPVLREIDELIIGAGGRIYLTKDSRMNSEHLKLMYPNLPKWKKIKADVDPQNLWQSDQGRRLGLC